MQSVKHLIQEYVSKKAGFAPGCVNNSRDYLQKQQSHPGKGLNGADVTEIHLNM